jgi:tetratricopeptide (TPR) repeat protein
MKTPYRVVLLGIALATTAFADRVDPLFEILQREAISHPQKPEVDAKRIVNQSNSFLKEREPEMTAEEYALYEKVVDTVSSNVEFALKMLEPMIKDKEKATPAFDFVIGNIYFGANQMDRAEKYYRQAVDQFPTFLRAWDNLGILYYTTNRFGDAVTCFSKAITLGDRESSTFGLLGYCLEKDANVVAAEMAYMQAMSGDPANTDWKEGLLRIYIDGKQYGRAESLVKKLIKERPSETRYWFAYAGVLIAQNRKIDAIVLLDTAAKTGVAGPDELILLGDLYAEQNLPGPAVAAYQKVPAASQDRGEEKLINYARSLISLGKLSQAQDVLAGLPPKLSAEGQLTYLQTRADLEIARKHWPEARAEAESLLKLAPLNGPALLTVGRSYAEEKDLAHAQFAFEEAYRIPETTYRASLELASLELKNRHYAKTAEYLEKAQSIQQSDTIGDWLARVKLLVSEDPKSNG